MLTGSITVVQLSTVKKILHCVELQHFLVNKSWVYNLHTGFVRMFGLIGGWTELKIVQGQHLDKDLRLRYQNNPGFSEIVLEHPINFESVLIK